MHLARQRCARRANAFTVNELYAPTRLAPVTRITAALDAIRRTVQRRRAARSRWRCAQRIL
jgi:hypothetical protein